LFLITDSSAADDPDLDGMPLLHGLEEEEVDEKVLSIIVSMIREQEAEEGTVRFSEKEAIT
jgi:hypothetical protein